MSVQDTYLEEMRFGVAGQIVNTVPATLISRTVEDVAGIGFGLAVTQGTNDKGCSAFGSGDTTILGITVRERSIDANDADEFGEGTDARVMTKGVVWVTCATGCSAGDGVFVRPSNGDFQDSNANSAVQIVGARWDTSADAAGIAQVRLG